MLPRFKDVIWAYTEFQGGNRFYYEFRNIMGYTYTDQTYHRVAYVPLTCMASAKLTMQISQSR